MRIKRALVLYKRSVYSSYFLDKSSSIRRLFSFIPRENRNRLQLVHKQHDLTLQIVEECLKNNKIDYFKSSRGQNINYAKFDLIITVGGDGTFLEAARHARRQLMLGVNSSPQWSVGNFCIATAQNFPAILSRVLAGRFRVRLLHRLRIKGIPEVRDTHILNDVLIAHANPAATSRYYLTIGKQKEEHRGSGIWISTAAGSTGAIHSAGGKVLPVTSDKFQFLCREIYFRKNVPHRLRQGVLSRRQTVYITSLMREGMIFLDGSRLSVSFPFGRTIAVTGSPVALRTVQV